MKASGYVVVICLSAACSERQNLTDPPPGNDAAPGTLPSKACAVVSVDAGTPPPIVGVWDGYMEQTFRATGNDQVHVVVRSSETGLLSATAVFGAPAAPPSPPETSETCDPVDPVTTSATPSAGLLQLLEGFQYQLAGVAMSDVRLQFNVPTYQPLANWCACQVPFQDSMYCIPNTTFSGQIRGDAGASCTFTLGQWTGHAAEAITTSCCRVQRCLDHECQCDASGCAYNDQFLSVFDLSINGTHADGSALHLVRTQ